MINYTAVIVTAIICVTVIFVMLIVRDIYAISERRDKIEYDRMALTYGAHISRARKGGDQDGKG